MTPPTVTDGVPVVPLLIVGLNIEIELGALGAPGVGVGVGVGTGVAVGDGVAVAETETDEPNEEIELETCPAEQAVIDIKMIMRTICLNRIQLLSLNDLILERFNQELSDYF